MTKVARKHLCVCAQGASLAGDSAVGTGLEFCSLSSQQMIQEHAITIYLCQRERSPKDHRPLDAERQRQEKAPEGKHEKQKR